MKGLIELGENKKNIPAERKRQAKGERRKRKASDMHEKKFNGQGVRVFVKDGVEWFVAKDVCKILCVGNVTKALRGVGMDEKADLTISEVSSNGVKQARKVNVVNESGLYALIFKSRKENAKAFRKWVTSEVLPSIRKTGRYDACDLRGKSIEYRNAFTAGCKRQGLTKPPEYARVTKTEYESLFGDAGIRKADMSRDQILALSALEAVEAFKYGRLPENELKLPGIMRSVQDTACLLEDIAANAPAAVGRANFGGLI